MVIALESKKEGRDKQIAPTMSVPGVTIADLEEVRSERDGWKQQAEDLKGKLEASNREVERLRRETEANDILLKQVRELKEIIESSQLEQSTQTPETGVDQHVDDVERRLQEAERIWERGVANPPLFIPVGPKRPPVISVLNLKGGVGKTTVTANLGATWWKQDRKVLFVDLDFQSSLSLRFFPQDALLKKDNLKKHAERLFAETVTGVLNPQEQFVDRLLSIPKAHLKHKDVQRKSTDFLKEEYAKILTASEKLADVETSLMIRWLFDRAGGDLRFRLREFLHSQAFAAQDFDYVLIDCPPRLTTACVNALAASDLVLVPVQPDDTALERVDALLRWLNILHSKGVCSGIKNVAVLRNRIESAGNAARIRDAQLNAWNAMKGSWINAWGADPWLLKAFIFDQQPSFQAAAAENIPAVLWHNAPEDKLRKPFEDLASELQMHMERWQL